MAARGIAHREWRLDRSDYRDEHGRTDETSFRAAVQNELALAEHMCERLGVMIVAAPVRTRVGDGWLTMAWAFKTATIPAVQETGEVEALEEALAEPALVEDPDPLVEVE
jgi:hypothetical protein